MTKCNQMSVHGSNILEAEKRLRQQREEDEQHLFGPKQQQQQQQQHTIISNFNPNACTFTSSGPCHTNDLDKPNRSRQKVMDETVSIKNTLIAYDCSGSTSGSQLYHETTQKIVDELKSKSEDFTIVAWDSDWKVITAEQLKIINSSRSGFGGTSVRLVAEAVKTLNFRGKLILITDGQVSTHEIDMCDSMLCDENLFTSVAVYLIATSDYFLPNMSVSCPFTRYCTHDVVTITKTTNEKTYISEEDLNMLNEIDEINTPDEFVAKKESILKALSARMMGKAGTDVKIHDQLVRLRKRIVNNIAEQARGTNDHALETLRDQLVAREPGTWNECLVMYRSFINNFYLKDFSVFESDISDMLNISKGSLRNTFSHRLRRSDVVESVNVDQVKEVDEAEQEPNENMDFICPITLDTEKDVVLLVKDGKPLMSAMSPSVMEDIFNCPLNSLNYPDVRQAIKDSFDSSISLSAYADAEKSAYPITRSPLTRADLSGVLYLGGNASQVAGSNATISRMLTGDLKKKIGNINLWFAVIYILLSEEDRFADIVPFAEKQMIWRLRNTKTFASLTGLTKYMNTRVPLDLACWMVVVSPLLELPPQRDMMRAHAFHMKALFELVKLSGLYIPKEAIDKSKHHASLLKTLYIMLSRCKRQPKRTETHIRALYQKCLCVDLSKVGDMIGNYCTDPIRWVPIDGEATQAQRESVLSEIGLEGTAEELIGIYGLINPSLSAETIALEINWKPQPVPKCDVCWDSYGLSTETIKGHIPICPHTCRPYYNVDDFQTWKETAEQVYKMDLYDLISANSCFIHFVEKYRRYPSSSEEFLTFMYYYYVVFRTKQSLPAPVLQFVNEVLDSYEDVKRTVSVEEFIERTTNSLMIKDRVVMEQV